jgi:endoglycosylceramidase
MHRLGFRPALLLWLLLAPACTGQDDPPAPAPADDTGTALQDDIPAPAPEPVTVEEATRMAWIRVQDGHLVDEAGREWRLRGINARVEGLFDVTFDDGRVPLQPIPDWNADDARQARALGFNFLRLPINWSGLEPQEGVFSDVYLARMQEVVRLTVDAGLWVLLDFHQDAYSKEIGEDGAPLWAIVPPPEQLLQGPLTDLSQRRVSRQVLNAFRGFFTNQENLQERFLPAFGRVAATFADEPALLGIEVMNEPVVNHIPDGDALLWAFYLRVLPVMREANPRHPLWLEPDTFRNFTLASSLPAEPFPDDNVVYCPHMYPGLIGRRGDSVEDWVEQLTETFDLLRVEARAWGNAAVVVGEWGDDPRRAEAPFYWRAIDRLTDDRGFGHAVWLWKENSQDSWGFFDFDEAADAWVPRAAVHAGFPRPYVAATPGRSLAHTADPDGTSLVARFDPGSSRAPLLVYLPGGPDAWTLTLEGVEVPLLDAGAGWVVPRWRPEGPGPVELRATRRG